jgi:hypothetical protein
MEKTYEIRIVADGIERVYRGTEDALLNNDWNEIIESVVETLVSVEEGNF